MGRSLRLKLSEKNVDISENENKGEEMPEAQAE